MARTQRRRAAGASPGGDGVIPDGPGGRLSGTLDDLRGLHPGETAWIIGKGPSLLRLTADQIGPGPVITLNQAILNIRALNLPNPVYSAQKDGCQEHSPIGHWPTGKVCAGPCPAGEMVQPVEPERLLVTSAESLECFADYPRRFVIDVEALGVPWHMQSAPVMTLVALAMGCTAITFVSHDAFTLHDLRRVIGDVLIEEQDGGYVVAGNRANDIVREAGIEPVWMTPP